MIQEYAKINNFIKTSIFKSNSIEEAIEWAEVYGNIRWRNNDGIYYEKSIEDFLFEKIYNQIHIKPRNINTKLIVVITSELYTHGGHTKVLVNWIKYMQLYYEHKLIVTRRIPKEIKEVFKKYKVDVIEIGNYKRLEKLNAILRIGLGAKYIILFIHPDDIVASIAARILSKLGSITIFYNHADHVFSYGICSADIVCEISRFGWELSRKTGRVKGKQVWIGIPISLPPNIKPLETLAQRFFSLAKKESKIILTTGSSWKYEPFEEFSFPKFINKLLKIRNDVYFYIIGSTGKEKWWRDIKIKWKERVKFFGTINFKDYEKIIKAADIYVDSFPVTGGTAFPEALLRGIPSVGLKVPFMGYNCMDHLRFENINELIQAIDLIFNADKEMFSLQKETLLKLMKFDSEKAFMDRVFQLYSLQLNKLKLNTCHKTNSTIDIFWLEKKWKKQNRINLLNLEMFSNLDIGKRIRIFYNFLKSIKYIKKEDLLKILVVTFLGKKYKYIKLVWGRIS